jgi:hypothetical protein
MIILWNDQMTKWSFYEMTRWQNDHFMKWPIDKMIILWNDQLTKVPNTLIPLLHLELLNKLDQLWSCFEKAVFCFFIMNDGFT